MTNHVNIDHEVWKERGCARAARRAHSRELRRAMKDPWQPFARQSVPAIMQMRGCTAAYKNNLYVVQIYPRRSAWGEILNLMVRCNDGQPVRSWADMQRVKDEICGPERVAVEIYPAHSDVVDDANLYHLWVLPAGFELPFGLHAPKVLTRQEEYDEAMMRG